MSDDPTPVKPKRVMSELQLEKLKLAREKAHAVKQQTQNHHNSPFQRMHFNLQTFPSLPL